MSPSGGARDVAASPQQPDASFMSRLALESVAVCRYWHGFYIMSCLHLHEGMHHIKKGTCDSVLQGRRRRGPRGIYVRHRRRGSEGGPRGQSRATVHAKGATAAPICVQVFPRWRSSLRPCRCPLIRMQSGAALSSLVFESIADGKAKGGVDSDMALVRSFPQLAVQPLAHIPSSCWCRLCQRKRMISLRRACKVERPPHLPALHLHTKAFFSAQRVLAPLQLLRPHPRALRPEVRQRRLARAVPLHRRENQSR